MASSIAIDLSPPPDRIGLAIIVRILAGICGATMLTLAKLASLRGVSPVETMCYRSVFAFPVVLAWIAAGPGLASVATTRPGAQLSRAGVGLASMALSFAAIGLLPVAELTAIMFVTPLFSTMLSALLLREHVGVHRWAAIVAGFIGILVMTRPGAGDHVVPLGVLLALGSAGLAGGVAVAIRQLGAIDPPTTTVFWFTGTGATLGAIGLLFFFQPHDPVTWLFIIGIGVAGAALQLLLTTSLHLAPVSATASLDYLQFFWVTMLSWLLWAKFPSMHMLAGAALIGAASFYTVYRARRRQRATVQEMPASI